MFILKFQNLPHSTLLDELHWERDDLSINCVGEVILRGVIVNEDGSQSSHNRENPGEFLRLPKEFVLTSQKRI